MNIELPQTRLVELPGSISNEVLVAEDDPMFRKILKTWLEDWGYRVTLAEDGAAAWNILQQEPLPELLILDWVMPGIDGQELCRRIREKPKTTYPYILLVTAKDDSADLVAGLDAGADDYLTKPLDRSELRARLKVGRRILSLQHGLIQAREDLRFQATHDVLTGMWNRGELLQLLQAEIERASRIQGPTGLLMLDLDHFKRINDTCGHLAGDTVLREVANRISQVVRSYDFVGRYGGEEFLVVLPGCDRSQVLQSAERIRSAIAEAPVMTGSSEITITVSIGATTVISGHPSGNEVLAVADTALYQAKDAGRNCTMYCNL
jgi:two-component system cell cycle response regulator